MQHHDTAIALSPYAYHNNSYTLSGDYTVPSPNCDTTFHLHLNIVTALPCDTSYGPTQQPRGCDAVVWDGQTYTQETRFFDTLVNSVGCDSIRHVHVIVYRSFKDSIFVQPDTNQASYTWAHNQQQYSANGIYYDSLHTVNGQCDSIYVLRLHWLVANCEPTYSERDTAVCGSMVWKGRRYTSSALLIDTLRNLDGCDSIATIRLTIKEQWQQLTDTSACDFLWYNGTTYTQSIDSITTLGRLANGCDSSRRLHITIRHSTTYNDTFTACERFRWENTVFSQTQDYVGNPRTNSQGCDSNIRLRIIILTGATTDTTAIACDSMTWHGTTYYDNGDYTFTTTGGNNCDSTVVLHLTIVSSQHDEITATSCDRYMWYEQSYTQSGNYTSVLAPTEDGCNHTVTLHLTILRSTTVRIDTSVCDYLAWHANYFRTDTVASFTTTNRVHCDSTEYLTLHIRHSSTSQRNVTACDSYTWHDSLFHHTTDYTHHATNHVGCDSAITLHLTIVHSDTVDTTIHACNRYTWHDSTYRSSTTDTFSVNDGNCHGAEIIHLVMGHSTTQRLQENRCDSLRWNDSTYTVSTTTQHTFTNVQGCDSTVTLQLYLRYSTHSYVSASECYSYTWHGITYYETTDTAKFVRTNTQGCDSVVHLRLTIRPSVEVDDTIKACERYVYNNRTYTSEAILNVSHGYTIYGCDSTTTQLLVIGHNGQNYNEQATACNSYTWRDNMTYYADTVINKSMTDDYGCENNYTLALTIHHDTIIHDTVQACNSYMWSGRLFTYSVTESLTGTTSHGCVQRNVLHLTIHKDKVRTIDTAVCEELRLDANTYTNSVENLRRSMGRTVHGCDSTLVLTLRIKGRRTDTNVVNCNTVVWDSTTYIASQDLIDTIPMDNGCDSIHTIHIIVTHPGTTVDIFQACDSLTWRNGITYYEDQLLIDTVHIAGGCDSIIYLSLKIDANTHSEITATANQPYLWDNETYTASGDYTHTYEAANGCDSTITLHLTYTTMRNPEILSHDQRLVMLNHYPNGQNGGRIDYYAYQWYCNGTPIEGATSDSYSYSSGGNLNGCFYVEVAVDANRNGWLRSNLICLGTYGIDDVDTPDGRLSIYPNPAERGATATLELTDSPAGTQEGTILLYDHLGRLILTQPCHAGDNTIVMPTTAGNYLLQLHTIDGRTTTTKVVVR